jgi:hypothetical protein
MTVVTLAMSAITGPMLASIRAIADPTGITACILVSISVGTPTDRHIHTGTHTISITTTAQSSSAR